MTDFNPRAIMGNNLPPEPSPFDAIKEEIEDLFDTAKDFADGEPIADPAMHDTIDKLYKALHDAGNRADALRVAEKKPLDEAVAKIQDAYNPLIQPKKGKVALGKECLATLLAAWRKHEADKKAAIAAAARLEAERIAKEAQEAMRASAGNLAAREEAEALLTEAKQAERQAKRDDKAATSGLGLRTVWRCTMEDEAASLDWAYARAPEQFRQMVQTMAEGVVRTGMRSVPGFRVFEEKVV